MPEYDNALATPSLSDVRGPVRVVERERDPVLHWMTRFGGAHAHVLADPTCGRFRAPGVEGVIPYRESMGCRVAIGDPVCHRDTWSDFAEDFRRACKNEHRSVVYAAASEHFASVCLDRGYSAIEFGEELIVDPQADGTAGSRGRELRKKIRHAEREGVVVSEACSHHHDVEEQMRAVASEWLAARRGPQARISPIDRLEHASWRRRFWASHGDRVVGVLTLVRSDACEGWSVQHLLHAPDSPGGTSESLVVHALRAIGADGAKCATFGTSQLAKLGKIHGVGPLREALARHVFEGARRAFALDQVTRFREKFGIAQRAPSYLLFHPRVGVASIVGLVRTFSAR